MDDVATTVVEQANSNIEGDADLALYQLSWVYHKLLNGDACGFLSMPIRIRFANYKS